MALVKCKECGNEISKKADACPKCGAKRTKKTSGFTWLVLGFFLLALYIGSQDTSKRTKDYSSVKSVSTSKSSQKSDPVRVVKVPSWTTFSSKDEMTGETSHYASSPSVEATRKMDFPYGDVESWVSVGCNRKSRWAYFGFSKNPNLNNTETLDGRNRIKTRIKWNDSLDTVTLTQEWGGRFLHAQYKKDFISKLLANSSILLELDWHGQNGTRFNYSLNGSSEAIKTITKLCGGG